MNCAAARITLTPSLSKRSGLSWGAIAAMTPWTGPCTPSKSTGGFVRHDAERRAGAHQVGPPRRRDQGLGGHAAVVEAVAAHLVLLDQHHRAELGGRSRHREAAEPAPITRCRNAAPSLGRAPSTTGSPKGTAPRGPARSGRATVQASRRLEASMEKLQFAGPCAAMQARWAASCALITRLRPAPTSAKATEAGMMPRAVAAMKVRNGNAAQPRHRIHRPEGKHRGKPQKQQQAEGILGKAARQPLHQRPRTLGEGRTEGGLHDLEHRRRPDPPPR